MYEYGIMQRRIPGIHRWGMTEEEARLWVWGWEDDGGKPDAFYVVRRSLGEWEPSP